MVKRVRIIKCVDCGNNAREERTVIKNEIKKIVCDCPYCNKHTEYH